MQIIQRCQTAQLAFIHTAADDLCLWRWGRWGGGGRHVNAALLGPIYQLAFYFTTHMSVLQIQGKAF